MISQDSLVKASSDLDRLMRASLQMGEPTAGVRSKLLDAAMTHNRQAARKAAPLSRWRPGRDPYWNFLSNTSAMVASLHNNISRVRLML
jgi:hypothetical protein